MYNLYTYTFTYTSIYYFFYIYNRLHHSGCECCARVFSDQAAITCDFSAFLDFSNKLIIYLNEARFKQVLEPAFRIDPTCLGGGGAKFSSRF